MREILKTIQIKRIYDEPAEDDGHRVLVDRLWPRGLTKADPRIDQWLKEIAPSTELRKFFSHQESRWTTFQERYRRELEGHPKLIEQLLSTNHSTITLLYAAKNRELNQAVVLRDHLITIVANQT